MEKTKKILLPLPVEIHKKLEEIKAVDRRTQINEIYFLIEERHNKIKNKNEQYANS